MANFIFAQPFELNLENSGTNLLLLSTVTQQTSTRFVFDDGTGRIVFQGTNITYNGNLNNGGAVTGGTIQAFLVTSNFLGNIVFANGFGSTVAAAQVFNFLSQGQEANLFSYLFRGNDRFVGSLGGDIMHAYGGNDLLLGKNGDDKIFGDAGDDRALGGFGNDTLVGGIGNDRLFGEAGIDVLYGQVGNDVLGGGLGNDVLFGQAGEDVLIGDDGRDQLFGGAALDRLFGGAGNDILTGGAGNDVVRGGFGDDVLNGTDATSAGNGERDILFSSDLNDSDTFVLGVNGTPFYNDQGNNDYALIRDFDLFDFPGDIADRIQLEGNASFYSLSNVSVGGVSGAGIFDFGDLVGIIEGINASQLSLTNSDQFVYV